MRLLSFQIRYPNGQTERISVEGERVLIGSGGHCDIRLPMEHAAVEHVLVELGAGENVFARGLHFQPPPLINNIPFTQAPLPPESVLGVGQVQILVTASDGAAPGIVKKQEKRKTSPVSVVVLVALLGVLAWLALGPQDDNSFPKPPKEVELWGPPITQCTHRGGEQALALARERRLVADAKRERRPFHVQDGVAAVPIYELAAACFNAGGDISSANQAQAAATALRKEMNDDYRTQRVRLEHALNVNDGYAALRQVKVLLAFTEGKQGDYVTFLSILDRRLKLAIGKAEKK